MTSLLPSSATYSYDHAKHGACYWRDPEFPVDKEIFVPAFKGLDSFVKRRNPFALFDKEVVDYCLSKRIYPLRSVTRVGGTHAYENHDSVILYLAKCQLKTREFYKVGLTTLANPKSRNPAVYSEIVRAHRIPVAQPSIPYLYEKFTLWKCTEHEYQIHDMLDPLIFKGFGGKTEVIHSNDPAVVYVFDQAFDQLSHYLKVNPGELAWLEVCFLTALVKAVYDERFVAAKAAWLKHSSTHLWDFSHLCDFGGWHQSSLVPDLSVSMMPKDMSLMEAFALSRLVPMVETAWRSLGIEDPVKRFERGKSNYQDWWSRRGGNTNYWKPRYYGWSV